MLENFKTMQGIEIKTFSTVIRRIMMTLFYILRTQQPLYSAN